MVTEALDGMTFKRHAAWFWPLRSRTLLWEELLQNRKFPEAGWPCINLWLSHEWIAISDKDKMEKLRNFSAVQQDGSIWIHMEVNASIRISNRISNPSPTSQTSPQHWSQDTLRLAWPHPLVLGIFAVLPSEELPEAARVNNRQGVDLNHFFAKSACHGSSPVWAGNCWINLINNMIMIWF